MTHNEFFFKLTKEERRKKVEEVLLHIAVRGVINNPILSVLGESPEDKEILTILAGAYMNGELKEDYTAIERVKNNIEKDMKPCKEGYIKCTNEEY